MKQYTAQKTVVVILFQFTLVILLTVIKVITVVKLSVK